MKGEINMQIDSKLIICVIICFLIYHITNKIHNYLIKRLDKIVYLEKYNDIFKGEL